uniref:Uncharacterized protein n=1 Tax=Solanum tuberosum TaxID=4113 RepID=M1E0F1_SOLTU
MHANILPNKLLDICVEAKKITKVTRINDVANPLYGSRVGPAPPLEVLPHVSVEPIRVEGVNEKAEGTTQASDKASREKEAFEQQKRNAMRSRALASGIPTLVDSIRPDTDPTPKQAHIDEGSDITSTTDT